MGMRRRPSRMVSWLFLFFGIFLSSGYRLAMSEFSTPMRWDINPDNPVIWVRVCDDVRQTEFTFMQFPEGDPLAWSLVTPDDIISSILHDFNSIPDSFLQLRWHAEEVPLGDAPPVNFQETETRHRIIDMCTDKTSFDAVAHAAPGDNHDICADEGFRSWNESYCSKHRVASCKIVLDESYISISTDVFTHVITHELGHCLGLLHNHETEHSVMSYLGDRQRTIRLQIDDKLGLVFLYPNDPDAVRQSINFGLTQCSSNAEPPERRGANMR